MRRDTATSPCSFGPGTIAEPELVIVGLISGTSADGIDAALVSIGGADETTRLSLRRFVTVPYPSELREMVLTLARGEAGVADVTRFHYRLGRMFGEAARCVLEGEEADAIASHGQTVCHLIDGSAEPATLQLGHPALIASATGATVVSDFRAGDIAAGGQGAPLVSFLDCLVLRHATTWRVALNIGGIANVTFVPPLSSGTDPIAFDTGPGNSLIDRLTQRLFGTAYDGEGTLSAAGSVAPALLEALLAHPYLRRPPPKSTGLEEFGDTTVDRIVAHASHLGLRAEDVLATATRFTAASISRGISQLRERCNPGAAIDEIVVSGGGAHNHTLMRFLGQEIPTSRFLPSDALGLPGDAKEAVAFAVLANQTLRGLPSTIPSCTGARRPSVLGSITPGANYRQLMTRLGQ